MTLEEACHVVFAGMTRQGPGSDASTRLALSLSSPPPDGGWVLDLGCGTGASTLVLAGELDQPILACDVNPRSLEHLAERAAARSLRIDTRVVSMDALDLPSESVSLIWSEGAVFTVGVETALRHWLPTLKPGGVVAFSDMCWLGTERPAEAATFFQECYPPMTDTADLAALCLRCGYRLNAMFVMPESDWWDEYFPRLISALDRERDNPDPEVRSVVAMSEREVEIARKFGGVFGYAFFILSKPAARRDVFDEAGKS